MQSVETKPLVQKLKHFLSLGAAPQLEAGLLMSGASRDTDICLHVAAVSTRTTLRLPLIGFAWLQLAKRTPQERYGMELSGWIQYNVIRCRSLLRDQQ